MIARRRFSTTLVVSSGKKQKEDNSLSLRIILLLVVVCVVKTRVIIFFHGFYSILFILFVSMHWTSAHDTTHSIVPMYYARLIPVIRTHHIHSTLERHFNSFVHSYYFFFWEISWWWRNNYICNLYHYEQINNTLISIFLFSLGNFFYFVFASEKNPYILSLFSFHGTSICAHFTQRLDRIFV